MQRLLRYKSYYQSLKIIVSAHNLVDKSIFQPFFEMADKIYMAIASFEFVRKFEEIELICRVFIQINLYMASIFQDIMFQRKSDERLDLLMKGKVRNIYCQVLNMLIMPYSFNK